MKKQPMAYPDGLRERKHGNIRYQYRIPQDLLQFFPRPVMSENLGTKDKDEAARRIYKRKAELEEQYARLRSRAPEVEQQWRTTITDAEAVQVARAMLASSTQADEEIRHEGLMEEYRETYHRPDFGISEEKVRNAASCGDYGGFADIASEWLMAHGFDLPQGSPDFRKVAREIAKAAQEAIKIKQRRDAGEFVDSPSAQPPIDSERPPAEGTRDGSPYLSKVIERFLDNQDKAAPMFKKYQAALSLLLNYLGDVPVSSIRQLHIDGYFEMVCKLPPRWSDEVRKTGVQPKELAKIPHKRTLAPKTFEDTYKAAVRPFLGEAKRLYGDLGFPAHLTVDGIKYRGTQKEGERKQRAFKDSELKRLFEGVEYQRFALDPACAGQYWLPVIGLYTGARVNEVCQLNPQCDIREEDGIWFFDFTEDSDTDDRVKKSIKTTGSVRRVPLHSKLIELGFLAYVERQRKKGSRLLFPQWVPTRGRASPAGEDWFREFLADTGLRDETPGKTVLGMHAFVRLPRPMSARTTTTPPGAASVSTGMPSPRRSRSWLTSSSVPSEPLD